MQTELDYDTFKSGPRKGQCKTVKDQLVKYLVETRKLQVVSHGRWTKVTTETPNSFYFVGTGGAIRKGTCKTNSINVAPTIHKAAGLSASKPVEEIPKELTFEKQSNSMKVIALSEDEARQVSKATNDEDFMGWSLSFPCSKCGQRRFVITNGVTGKGHAKCDCGYWSGFTSF